MDINEILKNLNDCLCNTREAHEKQKMDTTENVSKIAANIKSLEDHIKKLQDLIKAKEDLMNKLVEGFKQVPSVNLTLPTLCKNDCYKKETITKFNELITKFNETNKKIKEYKFGYIKY